MTQVKFYRVETLPEVGEVGSLYFVYGSGGVQSLLYICVGTGLFELYTPDLYELENKLDSLEDKVEAESQTIQHKIDNIDLTPIENKVDEGVSTLSAKIDNIQLPEIDITELAKEETTQTIKDKIDYILLSGSYAGALEAFFGLPDALPEYEMLTNAEICATLEEIMTSMDLGLTQEMAATITNNTLNEQ